jgi:DNA polymerase-3 subunit alpha
MFVHLRCHSHYSFLRAVPRPEEIVAAAVEHKMPAVALTDTNGLYAAVPFYQAAREAGVKPIVGAVLDTEFRVSTFEFRAAQSENRKEKIENFRILLLAAGAAGYTNLCQLVTARQLGERPLSLEALDAHRAGLIALCEIPKSENGKAKSETRNSTFETRPPVTGHQSPVTSHESSAASHSPLATCHSPALSEVEGPLATLKDIFGGALYLEVHRLSPGDGRRLREALELGRALGVPVVATNNVHFLRPDEHLHHRVLNAVRTGALLSKIAPPEITTAEAYFKSAEEMRRAFSEHPEALRATLEIAERCNLELELGRTIFPEYAVPEGETAFSYLWKLCFDGARRRYRPLRPEVLARLTHELDVIEKLHLAPYFLLVWDIVEEARRRGIPAVGRGSAASSMVSYCLGISRVCPLHWGLYFERFLNEQRGDIPDIDLDLCGARRDELLEWVYARWGEERVAMISSFVTMHARLAVREVAKVFGVPPGEVNLFTRRLPHRPVSEILQAIRTLPECKHLPAHEEPWKTILGVALRLDGFPRHLGIHPCGTVIAARPLAERVPLERATKGIVVTQYDMNAVEALGLIKMDLLGQRGLTTMSLALQNIETRNSKLETREEDAVDFEAIPEHDPATCAMLAEGRTMGVFQIESPGLRGLLRALRARTMEDLCLAIALIRPGASDYGSKETFLRRLRGREPVRYPHPALEPILAETLGICVYQEQVMRVSQAVGGLSLAEADLVRRAKAKFADDRERQRLHAKFLKAAARMGLEGAARDSAWQMVEKFAGFGFCKAHAATYADLAYRMAYLKAHYPAEFLAAMCSAGAGFYHVSAYVEEAKRWGIEVRLPSVNHSRMEYTAEPPRAMRIGLMQVKNLRMETIQRIVRSREERGPYRSLEDFLRRVPVERDEIEALIKCGALDGLGAPRPALLWQLNLLAARKPEAAPGESLFPDAAAPVREAAASLPALPDYTREQRLACEQEILEVCVSGHPLDCIARNGEVWSTDLERHRGRRVRLLGWLITFRHVSTKNYRNMMFATFEDQRGVFEAVLFPPAYERCGALVFETRALRVTGRVERDGQINCERLEPARA